jgi:hypothetical protein
VRLYQLEGASIEPVIMLVANDNWIQFTARYIVDYRDVPERSGIMNLLPDHRGRNGSS